VEDLAALITHAGGSALVFGHSSGGALALEAAARGVAMTKLAVYEPPYIDDGSRPHPAPDLAARITALVAAGHRGEAVEQFFIEGLGMPTDAVAASKADPGWPTWEAYVHTIPYEAAVCNAYSMPTDRLEKIQVPTLALVGGAGEDCAPCTARALTATIPHAECMTLDGQGHGVADDVLVPVLIDFFLTRSEATRT
jgi:pimeloyl-ACP methyl ester carboxylesterase